jgi:tetratricopeptide (TPR) repeat protein
MAATSRWRLLGAGVLLVAGVAAGVGVYAFRSRPVPPSPPEVPEERLDAAVVVALRASRERVRKDPWSAKAWGELGEIFIANEMDEDSYGCFAQAERLDPANPRWPYYQAGTLINRGDRDGALPLLQRAVERAATRQESNEVPRLLLAENLLAVGRLDEAEAHFRQVLERQPEEARAHLGMGYLTAARQDWRASRDHLVRCLGNPAARKKASGKLAFVCLRLGQAAEAEQFRQQAERLPKDGDWADPYVALYLQWALKKRSRYRLTESLEAAGRLADVAGVLRPMVQEFPDDYLPHLELGKTLGKLGQFEEAEAYLRRAVQLAPDKIQVHYFLGLVLFMKAEVREPDPSSPQAKGLYQEAAEQIRQAVTLKPDYGVALTYLGRALQRLGRPDEALGCLREGVRCSPEYPELHWHLGEALAECGAAAEARHHLEQSLLLAPPDAAWAPAARRRLEALPKAAKKEPAAP